MSKYWMKCSIIIKKFGVRMIFLKEINTLHHNFILYHKKNTVIIKTMVTSS